MGILGEIAFFFAESAFFESFWVLKFQICVNQELLVLSLHQMDSFLSAAKCIFRTALSPSRVWSLLLLSSKKIDKGAVYWQ